MKKLIILTVVLSLIIAGAAFAGIRYSKHDLSSSGGQNIRSTNVDDICVFCHTPHAAVAGAAPLWNRVAGNSVWQNSSPYTSSTMNGTSNGPVDANPISAACLSCHDGNLANETLANGPGSGTASSVNWVNNGIFNTVANLNDGTAGLTNDHPIGVDVTNSTDPDIIDPTNPNIRLFSGKVECASCHKVHDPTNVPFLAMSNAGSAMCLQCHNK